MPRLAALALLVLAARLPVARAEVYLSREEALHLACPAAEARAEHVTRFDENELREMRERTGSSEVPASLGWWRFTRGNECLGYACIDDVPGKAQPITFLLSTDAELRVRSIEILAYRETHGGEIRRADWRAQFVGKDPQSPLRVGRDVRNIAGATISCRSLTNGVRVRLEALRRAVAREAAAPAASAPATPLAPARAEPATGGAALRRCQLLMGTTLTITLDAEADERAEAALADAFAEVKRLEGLLSDWDPASELSALNRDAGGAARTLGPELETVLAQACDVSQQSAGAFDASVGPLVQLWRAARGSSRLPNPVDEQRAAALVGWRGIELDAATHRARLARPGMALDLGGIGKGFALERAAAVLRQRGQTRALLDFGGQFLALEAPRGASGWPVQLRDPRGAERAALAEFDLAEASLSTTSDDQQGAVIEGRACSHVCDPRRGTLVQGRLAASVLCRSATLADAWSTALYVLGAEGLPRAEEHGIAALVLEGDGSLHASASLRSAIQGQRP